MADGWERRQEQTRNDVLVAAGALIAEHGLDGLTMRKLAAQAGVAVATLFHLCGLLSQQIFFYCYSNPLFAVIIHYGALHTLGFCYVYSELCFGNYC